MQSTLTWFEFLKCKTASHVVNSSTVACRYVRTRPIGGLYFTLQIYVFPSLIVTFLVNSDVTLSVGTCRMQDEAYEILFLPPTLDE